MAIRIIMRDYETWKTCEMEIDNTNFASEIIRSLTDYWDKEGKYALRYGPYYIQGKVPILDYNMHEGDIVELVRVG